MSIFVTRLSLFSLYCLLVIFSNIAHAKGGVIRHLIANSNFPVAAAVEVPAALSTIYLSGKLPPIIDSNQAPNSPHAYGKDTKEQTIGVFKAIEKSLADIGLGLSDVIKLQVFLVGEPNLGNRMDMDGFMAAYVQFFGTKEQPNLPARSVLQIAGLANSAWRVEIEAVAVRSQ